METPADWVSHFHSVLWVKMEVHITWTRQSYTDLSKLHGLVKILEKKIEQIEFYKDFYGTKRLIHNKHHLYKDNFSPLGANLF